MSLNLEKELIIKKLSESMVKLNISGIYDQYPINAYYVLENLLPYKEKIINAIKKNIDKYTEVGLIQILQLLSYRNLDAPKSIYNLVLDTLIKKRKDPTLEFSFELNNNDINLKKFKKMDVIDYKKYKIYAESYVNINYPIFRGLGYNFYEIKDYFIKEYIIDGKILMFANKIIKKPKYLITGHIINPGNYENYLYFGKLPQIPKFPKLNSTENKIYYSINKILHNLGVRDVMIDKSKFIYNNSNNLNFQNNINTELKEKLINGTYNFLVNKYLK